MTKVLIEDWVWEAVCERYAQILPEERSQTDRDVIAYMVDKLGRQIAREAYPVDRRED